MSKIRCEWCGAEFDSEPELNDHMDEEHPDLSYNFVVVDDE